MVHPAWGEGGISREIKVFSKTFNLFSFPLRKTNEIISIWDCVHVPKDVYVYDLMNKQNFPSALSFVWVHVWYSHMELLVVCGQADLTPGLWNTQACLNWLIKLPKMLFYGAIFRQLSRDLISSRTLQWKVWRALFISWPYENINISFMSEEKKLAYQRAEVSPNMHFK